MAVFYVTLFIVIECAKLFAPTITVKNKIMTVTIHKFPSKYCISYLILSNRYLFQPSLQIHRSELYSEKHLLQTETPFLPLPPLPPFPVHIWKDSPSMVCRKFSSGNRGREYSGGWCWLDLSPSSRSRCTDFISSTWRMTIALKWEWLKNRTVHGLKSEFVH